MNDTHDGQNPVAALTFAVVGRVNEGKSSIVSALTENDGILIGPEPGTTQVAQRFERKLDGETLFTIIDTPGFQEPERALRWVTPKVKEGLVGEDAIFSFLKHFAGTDEFSDERELLKPIMDGAIILYVVDASHPFRANFECELELLRLTGRPRIALLNKTSQTDYTGEWREVLSRYFEAVQEFDAQHMTTSNKEDLLRAFSKLDEGNRPTIDLAVRALKEESEFRNHQSASIISELVWEGLQFRLIESRGDKPKKEVMRFKFYGGLKQKESMARRAVERVFNFKRVVRREPGFETPLFDKDLFSEETWHFLGQPRSTLVSLGAVTGGILGGVFDLKTAGATHFIGAPLGAVAGAVGSAVATLRNPETSLFGKQLTGTVTQIGPLKNPNFPWILLDRALLHYRAITTRTHAQRQDLIVDNTDGDGVVKGLPVSLKREFMKVFTAAKSKKGSDSTLGLGTSKRDKLTGLVEQVLREVCA